MRNVAASRSAASIAEMGDLLCIAVLLFQFVFLSRIALSLFPLRPGTAAGSARDLAYAMTEPVVSPLRRRLPPFPATFGFGAAEIIVLIGLAVLVNLIC